MKRDETVALKRAAQQAAKAYGRVLSRAFKPHVNLFRAWGAEGGRTGGKARAEKLTAEERRAIARKAARARWAAKPPATRKARRSE